MVEKGSEIGAHILSGAVVDPIALSELIPDWKDKGAPMGVAVTDNQHWVLSAAGKSSMPHFMMPPLLSNDGCYTLSLGNFTRWLGEQAEALGVPAADHSLRRIPEGVSAEQAVLQRPVAVEPR